MRPLRLSPLQQPLQRGFALDQRLAGEIAAVEIQQIENQIDKAVAAAVFQIGLQQREARDAVLILDDKLAVDQRGLRRQLP